MVAVTMELSILFTHSDGYNHKAKNQQATILESKGPLYARRN